MTTEPLTIPEVLSQRRDSPRGITFVDGDERHERWTFGELGEHAARVAGAYVDLGVGPGDRIGLLGSTTPELVAAVFGCWVLGAIAVPLAVPLRLTSTESLLEEITTRADKARLSLLAADERITGLVDVSGTAPTVLTLHELVDRGRAVPHGTPDADDVALIQFTSGSTARPKGVALTHRTLITNGRAASEHVGLGPEDVAVSWLPLYHDFGLIGLTLWPVVLDMATCLIPPESFIGSPKRWLRAMSDHRATITAAPNFAYGLAARALRSMDDDVDLSSLRVAANGAEPVDPETIDGFAEAAAPHGFRREALLGVYGLAEATLGVSSPPPTEPPEPWWVDATRLSEDGRAAEVEPGSEDGRPLVSVGQPIPGVDLQIRSLEDEPVPDGVVGEVHVRSDHAMLGYWEDPQATDEAVTDGWIRTGDLGVMGPGGLYITGRIKDMIIVGGRNLYPEDAERVTQRIPGVRKGNAVAFGILERAREGLVVIAETRLDGEEAAKLAKQVATEIRKALRIAADQVVLLVPGSLPKTPSGKLQRSLTRKLFETEEFLNQIVASAGRHLGGGSPAPATN